MTRALDDITLTKKEKRILRNWVTEGEDPYNNPWDMIDDYGTPIPFIESLRISSGLYDEKIDVFIKKNLAPLKITKDEEKALKEWLIRKNSYYQNPWFIYQEHGVPYSYIEAMRINKEMGSLDDNIYNESLDDLSASTDDLPF